MLHWLCVTCRCVKSLLSVGKILKGGVGKVWKFPGSVFFQEILGSAESKALGLDTEARGSMLF